ncbi:hypothetical protein Acr_00g0093030 [Actinidia rufa]|uniref:Uncharacterized protein n=1 Tax=Actinidia rufa TaxID=165716 RepID=A0A7J0DXV4_9ERIC|nr:hypothetical protein Acr_00g0093030 [Actinidia rufa]
MASKSNNNGRSSWEAMGKSPFVPRTPEKKGGRLLANAQREDVGLMSKGQGSQTPSATKIIDRVGKSSSEVRAVKRDILPRGNSSKENRACSHYNEAHNHSDSRTVALSKRKDPPR